MRLICKICSHQLDFNADNILSALNVLQHTQSHQITICDIIETSCYPFFSMQNVKQKAGIFASPESLKLSCKHCEEILLLDKKANGFALSPVVTHLLQHHDIQRIINTIIQPYYTSHA